MWWTGSTTRRARSSDSCRARTSASCWSRSAKTPRGAEPMRLAYLDAARGVALVLMVVNHTARYWASDDLARWPLIYVTTSAAGPTFLFLVGFVLPLSY